MTSVLVLNADYSYISRVTHEAAVRLLYKDAARAHDSERIVKRMNSPSTYIDIPDVLILNKMARVKYKKEVPFTRTNVFTRDKYICQYCGTHLNRSNATLDHVLPSSKGGKNNFENAVCCCHDCNNWKADRTPEQAKMPLLSGPFAPTINEFLAIMMNSDLNFGEIKEKIHEKDYDIDVSDVDGLCD